MDEIRYILFRNGVMVGKYTRAEWHTLTAKEIFRTYVYQVNRKCWYYSAWGSLIPINTCDLLPEIKALQLLINIDDL